MNQNYKDCLDFFYSRNQFSIKLGLENINALLDGLDRPDAGLTFLHVAGTNGKGSVCANLAALLTVNGYRRVGLYTSPHLVSFRERILVDGNPIPPEFIIGWLQGARAIMLKLNATYFECVTALALAYFKAQKCEAVVLETGLGGRLDATNAVTPAVTVITSISLDHTSILGDTVEKIWEEKIGILKPTVPMVVSESRPHLISILQEKSKAIGSPIYCAREPNTATTVHGENISYHGCYATYMLPLRLRTEKHQQENLALSLLAMEVFLKRAVYAEPILLGAERKEMPPTREAAISALINSRLPGRTQLVEEKSWLPILLDGAHNPAGIEALSSYIRLAFPGHKVRTIFSIMGDKDFVEVYKQVEKFSNEIWFVPLKKKFPRALEYCELERHLSESQKTRVKYFPLEKDQLLQSLKIVPSDLTKPQIVVVCGSLYLLGEVIPLLMSSYSGLHWFKQFRTET